MTYSLDATAIDNFLHKNPSKEKQMSVATRAAVNMALKEKEKIIYTGFVAQDVEKAAKEIGYNFSGVDAPRNENGFYGLRYAEFVVPLVKAVQEQQKIIEDQNKKIDQQQRQINQQQQQAETQKSMIEELKNQDAEMLKRIVALEKR